MIHNPSPRLATTLAAFVVETLADAVTTTKSLQDVTEVETAVTEAALFWGLLT
jgi:hypothetical protein